MRTVSNKMGIREKSRSFFWNAPDDAIAAMQHPEITVVKTLTGEFDYIHLFVKTQAEFVDEFVDEFPKLKPHLKPGGMLWVSWPKAKQLGTDLTLPIVIKLGYDFGLVESTALSVNPTWSAIKFTHPKKGKEYKNSYGKLSQVTTTR